MRFARKSLLLLTLMAVFVWGGVFVILSAATETTPAPLPTAVVPIERGGSSPFGLPAAIRGVGNRGALFSEPAVDSQLQPSPDVLTSNIDAGVHVSTGAVTMNGCTGAGTFSMISRSVTASAAEDGSGLPAISADGQVIAFVSSADNLVTGDMNNFADVFVFDGTICNITRISVATDGTEANHPAYQPSVSGNGRFVVFDSTASNLTPGDDNGASDIFLHDRATAATQRISLSTTGSDPNGSSTSAMIAANGQMIVFRSRASNLVNGDTNGVEDVFAYDLSSGQITRVSIGTGNQQGEGPSFAPSVSGDGRYIAFLSMSGFGGPAAPNTYYLYVRDLQTGTTTQIAAVRPAPFSDERAYTPAFSADGRLIAFTSEMGDLVAGDSNQAADIFVFDQTTQLLTRVSLGAGGTQTNGASAFPSLSGDGRSLTFQSDATNLIADDTNNLRDVFVLDLETGEVQRIAPQGVQPNGPSLAAAFSSGGQFMAFVSRASNLLAGDSNGVADIFFTTVQQADTPQPGPIFTVNKTADTADGTCGTTDCSLREAIIAANAYNGGAGGATVSISAGTYTLSIAGTNEDASATGDLDIRANVTIVGAGAAFTTINGNGLDRVLHIVRATDAVVRGVTIENGNLSAARNLEYGAGIWNAVAYVSGQYYANTLTLEDSIIQNNIGQGIANAANLTIERSIVRNNVSDLAGAGIYNGVVYSVNGPNMVIVDSEISHNTLLESSRVYNSIDRCGAGIHNFGELVITGSLITENANPEASGGGLCNISIDDQRDAEIINTTITKNTARAGGGSDFSHFFRHWSP